MSKYIIGCDENGWGAIFSILVVSGIRAPIDWKMDGLNDSKKLTPKRRQELRDKLYIAAENKEISFYIAERTSLQIDEFGCYNVLKDAYVEVFRALYQEGDKIIVDGNLKFDGLGVDDLDIESVIKGDSKFPAISAASIIGKVYRDGKMEDLHKDYPLYDLNNSHGYPSPKHKSALEKYGYTELHRKSYQPIKGMIEKEIQKNEEENKKIINQKDSPKTIQGS